MESEHSAYLIDSGLFPLYNELELCSRYLKGEKQKYGWKKRGYRYNLSVKSLAKHDMLYYKLE